MEEDDGNNFAPPSPLRASRRGAKVPLTVPLVTGQDLLFGP
jgi:hypothetical protein